jgi:hypothetical protein
MVRWGEPGVVAEQPVEGGDVAGGQHTTHVLALVEALVDRRPVPRCRCLCYRGELVSVPVAHPEQ